MRRKKMHTDQGQGISPSDFDRLIEAIKHPVVQVRPLEERALAAIRAFVNISRSLRTVFLGAPDRSTTDRY
jgi:hypothetical protein